MERSKIYKIMSCLCKISLTAYSLRKSSSYGKKPQNSLFPNGNTNVIPLNHSKQKSSFDRKSSLPHLPWETWTFAEVQAIQHKKQEPQSLGTKHQLVWTPTHNIAYKYWIDNEKHHFS